MQNLQLPLAWPPEGSITVLGMMSGTSLDGLDLALCRFYWNNQIAVDVLAADTVDYSSEWRQRLKQATALDAIEMQRLDVELGTWFAAEASRFLERSSREMPDVIASHGHTIFHQPDQGFTLQIGSGAVLNAQTGVPVVCDFRTQDVALGGQGAPLVPIGDRDLYGSFDACVNLGGFANVSMERAGVRTAWDICPVNVMMNPWAEELGMPYDEGGRFASRGEVRTSLLETLNALPFYQTAPPRSLGIEWVNEHLLPLFDDSDMCLEDKLRTYVEHIAQQIANALEGIKGEVLFTGGGVWNTFLMDRIRANSDAQVRIPETQVVNFKEAIVFAYLGLLRWYGQRNVLASVTGASKDHVAGSIYG